MHSSAEARQVRKRHLARAIVLTLAVGVMALTAVIFLGLGRWLAVEDPLDKAPAIVVLSGRIPMGAKEELAGQGERRKWVPGSGTHDWAELPLLPSR
jgi:hypothetical protein